MDDKTRALLGDREAAKRLTDAGVVLMQGDCLELKQNAINAACEAIQAAAMCQKFLDMEGSIHDGEGGQ